MKCSSEPTHIQESDLGNKSLSVNALGSSTNAVIESQNRVGSLFSSNANIKTATEDKNSPDFDNFKSPSTEFTTSTVESTPIDEQKENIKNMIMNENSAACYTEVDKESKRYFV